MQFFLSPFAPENLVSRDGFSRFVPLQPAHSRIWCLFAEFLPTSVAVSFFLFKPSYAIGSDPSLLAHVVAYRWHSLSRARRHRASKPQGSSSNGWCPYITIDQLTCASLSHIHYCTESIALTPFETQQGYRSAVVCIQWCI